MDYQFAGFVFACIGAVISLGHVGVAAVLLRKGRRRSADPRDLTR